MNFILQNILKCFLIVFHGSIPSHLTMNEISQDLGSDFVMIFFYRKISLIWVQL